jgi:hypothetical protein
MIAGLILAGLAVLAALGVTVLAVKLHRARATTTVNPVHLNLHGK